MPSFLSRIKNRVVTVSIDPDATNVEISHRPKDTANHDHGLVVACDMNSLQTLQIIPYKRFTALMLVISEHLTTKLDSNNYFQKPHCNHCVFTIEEGTAWFRRNYGTAENCMKRKSFYNRDLRSVETISEIKQFPMQTNLTEDVIEVLCYAIGGCINSDTRTLDVVLSVKGVAVEIINYGEKRKQEDKMEPFEGPTDEVFDILIFPIVCWLVTPFVFVAGYYG